ncbi:leucyl/phenylalanyl-tRNA--protein transferase [Limnobacter sp.]|uniref:leucyl/phenylalanyl-tRNA--protein transferase n=1 Tax=Limnobacter sp. TaxID=2003368 RepID=UPI0035114D33
MTQPTIPWLLSPNDFPVTSQALRYPPGLLAASQHISADWLMQSYPRGIFPWYSHGEPVLWWSTSPRAVLYLEEFKLHRSLRKTIRRQTQDKSRRITLNMAFEQVMRACAEPRPGQDGTWITEDVLSAYCELHQRGHAHSVEHWHEGQLVGGLYCVAFGQMVYGESMFAKQTDASKVAFAHWVYWLKAQNVRIMDCQQATSHLMSFGARTISRETFEYEMAQAVIQPGLTWQPCELKWTHDST